METNDPKEQKTKDKELFEKGWSLHVDHMYDRAAKCYQKAAELGNTEALYFLALLYYEGKGVKKDFAEAARCFEVVAEKGGKYSKEAQLRLERLAELGDASAQRNLAYTLINDSCSGVGIGDLDYEEALKWFKKAAQGGDSESQRNLADFYYDGSFFGHSHPCLKQDKEEAFYWQMYHLETCEFDDFEYYYTEWGFPYGYGSRGRWTTEEAFRLFKKYAEEGDAVAQFYLGRYYYEGKCVKRNRKTAIKWFTKSAEQGKEIAQYFLGEIYYNADGVERNYEEAFKWYRKSAKQGRAMSQYMLGEFYCNGLGVAKDEQEAFKWYRKSAQHTDKEFWRLNPKEAWHACEVLGQWYHEGKVVEQDEKKAVQWYEKAGRILWTIPVGWKKELCKIADSYFYGEGIGQNTEAAIKWYKNAARWGSLYAEKQLASIFEEGLVVKQDYQEAYKWYDELVQKGDIEALYITGLYCLEGKGVNQNQKEALARIKKAAEQGYKPAQKKLAKLSE